MKFLLDLTTTEDGDSNPFVVANEILDILRDEHGEVGVLGVFSFDGCEPAPVPL
jgi:hypothetical protein